MEKPDGIAWENHWPYLCQEVVWVARPRDEGILNRIAKAKSQRADSARQGQLDVGPTHAWRPRSNKLVQPSTSFGIIHLEEEGKICKHFCRKEPCSTYSLGSQDGEVYMSGSIPVPDQETSECSIPDAVRGKRRFKNNIIIHEGTNSAENGKAKHAKATTCGTTQGFKEHHLRDRFCNALIKSFI